MNRTPVPRTDVHALPVHVAPEVEEALAQRRAVTALETAVVTHGLPRKPLAIDLPCDAWSADAPAHLEIARQMARVVRTRGAVPALIGVLDGRLIIGLSDDELQRLAAEPAPAKASASTLAAILHRGQAAGTTVSATVLACELCRPNPIRVFATGGIGGVHRNWTALPDISPDLHALSRHRVCVVSSGAKSILDLRATREALETLCVPVLGYRTERFPWFHHAGTDDLRVDARVESAEAAAALCVTHWTALDQAGAILLCQPVPEDAAVPAAQLDRLIALAMQDAEAGQIRGAAVTPYLLERLSSSSDGRTLRANLALLLHNAQLAADVAAAMVA